VGAIQPSPPASLPVDPIPDQVGLPGVNRSAPADGPPPQTQLEGSRRRLSPATTGRATVTGLRPPCQAQAARSLLVRRRHPRGILHHGRRRAGRLHHNALPRRRHPRSQRVLLCPPPPPTRPDCRAPDAPQAPRPWQLTFDDANHPAARFWPYVTGAIADGPIQRTKRYTPDAAYPRTWLRLHVPAAAR
jgi:hypothetical protein